MSYNFINEASIIRTSPLCYFDTVNGYKTDFTENGNVDGWDYYDGIHTYGCWGGFIFATLFTTYALIGRTAVFYPVPAESHYYVKITMKIKTVDRVSNQAEPTTARLQWTTTSDSSWNTTKSHDFTIYNDNEWHAYILNMGQYQYWQGDINNLRLYPILSDGRSGDEFFIKSIKISSIDTYACRNSNCDYYSNYEHPCPGIGTKGSCTSTSNSSSYYTITEDVNDIFIININDYGNETIKLDPVLNATGPKMAKELTRAISKIGIGGYSEVEIDYTEDDEFIIYSGTYTTDSNVVVVDSAAGRTLGFYDDDGNDLSIKQAGTDPASEAESASTFKIKSFQTLSLFDDDEDTSFYFDPFMYNVEGGRRDWLSGGLGVSNINLGTNANSDASNVSQRDYDIIDNTGKTIVDFNHPFNTSGRIRKIYAMCTLDQGYESVSNNPPATAYEGRISATGCKVLIIRPRRNGKLEVVDSIDIPDRDYSGSRLYSYVQESIDLDCDVWVNKGDLLGIYNANLYTGRSISGDQVDALYYQVNDIPSGEFDPGELHGDGVSGLLIYARSDKRQDQLVLDVDFGNRVNVEDISIIGSVDGTFIEYNIARCLDIDWTVDLFGGQHNTGYKYIGTNIDFVGTSPTFTHDNVAYGIDKLSDGVYLVKDGYAADNYSIGTSNPYSQGDPVDTFVPTGVQYFFVNGDQEWLGVYQFTKSSTVANPFVENFNEDPVAFVLLFPYGLNKTIYKSSIYFKEKWNFRNFGLAVTYNLDDVLGDAADNRFHYIEEFTAVTMDDFRIEKDGYGYDSVDYYLFANPNHGEPIFEFSGQRDGSGAYLGEVSNYIEYSQASNLDWTYLSHEFDPISCKGFMFYCDYHYSTKITEMELFCRVEDIGSNLVGGMSVSYSYYNDLLWQADLEQDSDTEVIAFIGDTPRYFTIEIEPITETTLSEIRFNIKEDDLYIGDKGCEYQVLPVHAKSGAENTAQIVKVKNIYNSDYNLYIDIAQDNQTEGRLIYHSRMNNFDSITNPEVGPDSRYYKSEDYPLSGVYKNCAINCDCWGLRNLIDGKTAYYSYDNGYSWFEFGTLSSGVSIDFTNIAEGDTSEAGIPVLSRNRYWKLVWLAEDHPVMDIREMIPFYEGEEVDCVFYHEKTLPRENGPINDTAPHLRNNSVTGSYYELDGTTSIGMDLGSQKSIDKLVWFHDSVSDYDNTYCGIDKYTELNLTVKDSNIVDYSYNEHSVTTSGYFDIRADSDEIRFDGSGLITVPTDPGFKFQGNAFTLDFQVDFNDLPVPSGLDYTILLQNWSEDITTNYRGDIEFPPPYWIMSRSIETGGASLPESNYLIFIRAVYNLARMGGATYSADGSLYYGPSYAFDGNFGDNSTATIGTSNGWLKVTLPEAKNVTRYGFLSYNSAHTRDVDDFAFQVYVTASGSWQTLHSVTNFLSYDEPTHYDITNPYTETEYRLYVYSNKGAGDYTGIQEFMLFDDDTINKTILPQVYSLEAWWMVDNYFSPGNYNWHYQSHEITTSGSYHVQFSNPLTQQYTLPTFYLDGVASTNYTNYGTGHYTKYGANQDIKTGKNFNGSLRDVRITKYQVRTASYTPRERLYTMSIYVSEDNIAYGKYCDVDLYAENSYSYYYSSNVFSSDYYSKFAIDLENRYDLELIRSYGESDTQPFSIYGENSTDVYYSNDEVDDINQVTWFTRDAYANIKTLWSTEYASYVNCPSVPTVTRSFTAIDCTGLTKENGLLMIDIHPGSYSQVIDTTRNGKIQISSSGGIDSETWEYSLTSVELGTLEDNVYHTFYLPLNNFNTIGSELDVSNINYVSIYYYCKQNSNSSLYLYCRNAKIVWSVPEAVSVANDVRWLRFDLLSGDGTDRSIRKLGVYPDISTQLSPAGGHYNHEWDYLGKSITAYESSTNLALGATTSGSSYFGIMTLDKLTDGIINSGEDTSISEEAGSFYEAWGSEDEPSPWIYVDLGSTHSVYRFKIYHGYDGVDTDYLITDYQVQTSTDNQIYTTHFTITDNDEFERIHDLTTPVQARYIKIAITDYDTKKILLRTDLADDAVSFFKGAVMREIEVYEYYGYPIISSEEYPIVAINMFDQFYLSSHTIIGVDSEDNSDDWIDLNKNFCYSDSVLDNPSKVDFREWNGDSGYDRWAVVKTDSATNYNSGPHYLKHVRITSSEDQNPCVYPWWWQTSVSETSRDYSHTLFSAISALKVEYPASTIIDDISFIEGDHFDVDELASWRDGLSFRIRFDDIDNLDRSFGYFYFGGYDSSSSANPITYKWYISTLSGSLSTGWNRMFLRFKQADDIDYIFDSREDNDLRIINTIDLGKLGMRYRGIGNELTIHFDGFRIERNRFYDYSAADVGFYMNNSDYITAPIGEYDMSKGTIEFWMRPDYDYNATDYYGTMRNRAVFSFNNNTNDVFGLMFTYNGIELYFGNTVESINVLSLSNLGISILDTMFHIGIVFSNDGTQIDSDGSTVRLYFNNELLFKSTDTWEVYDNKHFTFIFGGTAPLNLKAGTYLETSSVDAVISDFKMYNYCKKNFYNSIRNMDDAADKLIKPSNFIEISKDNLTYYKVGATKLPLIFENVAPNEVVPVYVKIDTPDDLTGKENRTAGLLCYWDISV